MGKRLRYYAMSWWNDLLNRERVELTAIYYYPRTPESLTGREIELIYQVDQSITLRLAETLF